MKTEDSIFRLNHLLLLADNASPYLLVIMKDCDHHFPLTKKLFCRKILVLNTRHRITDLFTLVITFASWSSFEMNSCRSKCHFCCRQHEPTKFSTSYAMSHVSKPFLRKMRPFNCKKVTCSAFLHFS